MYIVEYICLYITRQIIIFIQNNCVMDPVLSKYESISVIFTCPTLYHQTHLFLVYLTSYIKC